MRCYALCVLQSYTNQSGLLLLSRRVRVKTTGTPPLRLTNKRLHTNKAALNAFSEVTTVRLFLMFLKNPRGGAGQVQRPRQGGVGEVQSRPHLQFPEEPDVQHPQQEQGDTRQPPPTRV